MAAQMALALAICEICPPNEVDAMNAVLLNLFDTRSSLMNLLKTMIDLEIQKTGARLVTSVRVLYLVRLQRATLLCSVVTRLAHGSSPLSLECMGITT